MTSAPREIRPLLKVTELTVIYPARGERGPTVAVDRVSFEIARGETVALVGTSGSGKTSTALAALRLLPASGTITFDGATLPERAAPALRSLRRRLRVVLQDPGASLTPWMSVGAMLAEAGATDIAGALREVGLEPDIATRLPHALSGGQQQRVALARALASNPELLVLDEGLSALDLIVRDHLLALLERLRRERRLACLLITHDLAVVARLADRVLVMEQGRLVESASVTEFFSGPAHPTSRALLAAVAWMDPPASDGGDC